MRSNSAARLAESERAVFFARDDVLLKRYAESRRRHPLSHLGLTLPEALTQERRLLEPLRAKHGKPAPRH